jgi:hypothetical protein
MIKSRSIRWAGHVARMGKMGIAYKILVEKYDGKKPFGRPRCKWEDNVTRLERCNLWSIPTIQLFSSRRSLLH